MPVILIVYEAQRDLACWLYIQEVFERQSSARIDIARATCSVRVPAVNTLNEATIREFAKFRDRVLDQSRGVIRHHD